MRQHYKNIKVSDKIVQHYDQYLRKIRFKSKPYFSKQHKADNCLYGNDKLLFFFISNDITHFFERYYSITMI